MARIKKFSPKENLRYIETFTLDEGRNSRYFKITEFKDTFTGGKNGFLIEGTPYLKESTEIKIEILDVEGNPVYFEPGDGIPEYYEGVSKVVAVYLYEDTPIGEASITILGELKEYIDDTGLVREVPEKWKGVYNVKWQRDFTLNRNLPNEDKVRFYRRPDVSIQEIENSIFLGNPETIEQTGSVVGIPLLPNEGQDLTGYSLPTSYRLKINDTNAWTGSIIDQQINFQDINYNPTVIDVVNKNEITVSPPYAPSGTVESFGSEFYTASFVYQEGVNESATSLTGAFAKFRISNLKTFVGDVSLVKVFRKSRSQISDFEFIQEIPLESNELLIDIESGTTSQVNYGLLTDPILTEYWESTVGVTTTFDEDILYNSVNLNGTSGEYFFTSQSLEIDNDIEYTLNFNVIKESVNSSHFVRAFLSGSVNGNPVEQDIVQVSSTTDTLEKTNINENIISQDIDNAKLYFEVEGSDWYINTISFKASEETAFSPDEIKFVQQVPKILPTETFDYRFEFYDINNNYIPVRVEKTKTFSVGNLSAINRSLDITPSSFFFTFDSGSNPIPPTVINLDIEKSSLSGSVTFTSGAFDRGGNLIPSSSYTGSGEQYPGLLNDITSSSPSLTVGNFTGSLDTFDVQYITYTGTVEGVSDTFTIAKVRDGERGDDSILVDVDPNPILLGSDPTGNVLNYQTADTEITVRQGEIDLIFSDTQTPGTFFTSSIQSSSIDFGVVQPDGEPSMSILGFSNMTELSASVTYDFDIYPLFSTNEVTRSVVQRFVKVPEGAGAIEVLLDPVSANLPADESGLLDANDYNNADTTISVKQDEQYLIFTGSGEAGTFQVTPTPTNISQESSSSLDRFSTGFNDTVEYKYNDLTAKSASVDYELTVYPYSLKDGVQGVQTTINRKQIFTKTTDGAAARNVRLTAKATQVVYDDFNQVVSPEDEDITLTARAYNTTGSAYFTFLGSGSVILQGPSTDNQHSPTSLPDVGTQDIYEVNLRDGSPTSPIVSRDSISIVGIKEGRDTYTSQLSSPTATINIDVGGTIDLSNTGTLIRGYKGGTELEYTQSYQQTGVDSNAFPVYEGQFSASVFAKSSYITVPSIEEVSGSLYASHSVITDWTDPQINEQAFITYKIDFENGKSTQFVTQNLTAIPEGAVGPGIVFRGEWTGSIDYIYSIEQSRRDAVLRDGDDFGNEGTFYFATTENLVTSSSQPFTTLPFSESFDSSTAQQGDTGSFGWQYLGEQDFFVAAKIAIFEESFVENTINVGVPPAGTDNPQIVIQGGTEEPYIAIGQTGTIGYLEEGIWLGRNSENSVTESKLSLVGGTGSTYNSLEWDGSQLIIRGGITQLPSGEIYENVNRGYWQEGSIYYSGSIVQYAPSGSTTGSYSAVQAHTASLTPPEGPNEPPSSSFWQLFVEGVAGSTGPAGADAKTIRLISDYQAFKIDETGSVQSPSNQVIEFTASLQNISSPVTWSAVDQNGSSVTLASENPTTATLEYPEFTTNAVTVTAEKDGLSDETTIVKLVDGSGALTIVNTNQAHTFPTDPTGSVTNFDGSRLELYVYEGATIIPYNGVISGDGQWTVFDTIVTPTGALNGTTPTRIDGGDYFVQTNYTDVTSSADISAISVEFVLTGSRFDGTPFEVSTVQTLTKSFAGAAGQTGSAGAGVVYRGAYTGSAFYYYTDTRRDVVQGTDGDYYLFAQETGLTGSDSHQAPTEFLQTDWDTFGATFESVATDILFAQDVYANRTINIGAKGGSPVIALNADSGSYENPYISIDQPIVSQSYAETGIYLGYSGSHSVFSIVSSTGSLLWNGSTLEIDGTLVGADGTFRGTLLAANGSFSGSVIAEAGNIGGWEISNSQISKDDLVLDSSIPAFQVTSGSTSVVSMRGGELSSLISSSAFLTGSSEIQNNPAADTNSSLASTKVSVLQSPDPYSYNNTPISFQVGEDGVYDIIIDYGDSDGSHLSVTTLDNTDPGATAADLFASATYGFYIRAGSGTGTIVKTITVSNESIAVSNDNVENSTIPAGQLQTNGSFNAGTIYYVTPFVSNGSATAFYGSAGNLEITLNYQTISIDTNGFSVSQGVSKTEIVGGGLQIVNSTNVYWKASRNAIGTTLASPFIESDGYWVHSGSLFLPESLGVITGGTTAQLDSNGQVGTATSVRRSKINIVSSSCDWLHNLIPVEFNYRKKDESGNYTDEYYDYTEYGLIAEEVESVNKEITFYKNDELYGVKYAQLITPILKLVQEQEKRISKLEEEIEILKNK